MRYSFASNTDWMLAIAASSRCCDLAVGRFQPARARGFAVERGGEPGAVDAERMELARQPFLAAVGLAPSLDRGVERVQRERQTLDRLIDRALVGHRLHPRSKTLAGAKI